MITDKFEPRFTMIRFLLGEMQGEERAGFEDEFTRDAALFHSLVELENDLLDLYAGNALSPSERKRLEHSFLADPERRRRLPFSKALMSYPGQEGASTAILPQPWFRHASWSMLAVAAVLLFAAVTGITWLLVANHRLRAELATLQHQEAIAVQKAASLQQQVDALTKELNAVGPPDQNSVSFTLTADALRGNSEVPKLTIPPKASFAVLHLVFPADRFSSYHLFLETPDGQKIWQKEHAKGAPLGAGNKEIVIRVPSRLLQPGDYVLRITAGNGQKMEDVAGYSFGVFRQ